MVAQALVDLAELVDVEAEHDVGHVPAWQPDRHLAVALLQEGAAGQQTGKRVVIGQEAGALFRRMPVGHVPRDADEGHFVAEAHFPDAEVDRDDRAILALGQHLPPASDDLRPAR